MMRAVLIVGILFAITIPSIVVAQQCERQCFRDCSSGRCCTRCVTRCWTPRYVPQYTPEYSQAYAGPQFDPAVVFVVVVAGLIAIAVALISAATSSDQNDIDAIDQSTRAIHAQAREHDEIINAIHEHVTAEEHAAYHEGRRMADEEFYR